MIKVIETNVNPKVGKIRASRITEEETQKDDMTIVGSSVNKLVNKKSTQNKLSKDQQKTDEITED